MPLTRSIKYVFAIVPFLPSIALADLSGGADAAGAGTGISNDLPHFFAKIANILIYIVGAVAVIMLIIGGLRYVVSQGDSAAVKQAKDIILYGVIGVIVAIVAYAIVHFIAGALT